MIDVTSPTVEANCFLNFLPPSGIKFSLRAKRTVSDGKSRSEVSLFHYSGASTRRWQSACLQLKITPQLDRSV